MPKRTTAKWVCPTIQLSPVKPMTSKQRCLLKFLLTKKEFNRVVNANANAKFAAEIIGAQRSDRIARAKEKVREGGY